MPDKGGAIGHGTSSSRRPVKNARSSLIVPLLGIAAPIATGIMAQTGYHVINAFWVGKIGAEAVAVVTVAFPVNMVLIALGSGLSMAGSILIAQNHGAKNHQQVNQLVAQTLSGMAMLAVVLAAAGVMLAPDILRLLGAEHRIFIDSLNYLRITFAGSVFVFLSMSYQAILRGLGEARAPLMVIVPGVVLNAVLDPIMIFGWGPLPALGVQGAACATVLTQFTTSVAGIYLTLRPRFGIRFRVSQMRPDWPMISSLLRIGIPASIEQSMGALTVSVMTYLASGYGTIALASYGIVFRLMTFAVIPSYAVSMATSILVGRSLGMADTQQASRIAVLAATFNFALMFAVSAILILRARPIAGFFVPGEPQLITYCATVLQLFALAFPMAGIQSALAGAFRGAGDATIAMALSLLGNWAIQIPLSIALSRYTVLADIGLWWAMCIAAAINAAIATGYYRSGRWQRKLIR